MHACHFLVSQEFLWVKLRIDCVCPILHSQLKVGLQHILIIVFSFKIQVTTGEQLIWAPGS